MPNCEIAISEAWKLYKNETIWKDSWINYSPNATESLFPFCFICFLRLVFLCDPDCLSLSSSSTSPLFPVGIASLPIVSPCFSPKLLCKPQLSRVFGALGLLLRQSGEFFGGSDGVWLLVSLQNRNTACHALYMGDTSPGSLVMQWSVGLLHLWQAVL